MNRVVHGTVLLVVAVFLSACGGGGGSGSDTAPSPTPGDGGSAATGLVPVAPAVGATLVADATTLRPLRAGAAWVYRGSDLAGPGVTAVVFTNRVTQAATSLGVMESASNAINDGPDSTELRVASGDVVSPTLLDVGGRPPGAARLLVELRSPVRANDQYTLVDQRFNDTTQDLDGDGKPEPIDLAIYARVVGSESVALPNLATLQAIRVDLVSQLRVRFTKDGKLSDVYRVEQSNWYAQGVGIIQSSYSEPTASGNGRRQVTEVLVSYDGVTEGLGAMAARAVTVPPGLSVPFASVPGLKGFNVQGVRAYANHVLLVMRALLKSEAYAVKLDTRGNLLGSRTLSGSDASTVVMGSNEIAQLESASGGSDFSRIAWTRYDAEGALIGATRGQTIDLSAGRLVFQVGGISAAAMDNDVLWLGYRIFTRDPSLPNFPIITGSRLRGFDRAGLPVTPEMALPDGAFSSNMLVNSGRVWLTWSRDTGNGYESGVSHAAVGDSALSSKVLGSGSSSAAFFQMVPAGDGVVLRWGAALAAPRVTLPQSAFLRVSPGPAWLSQGTSLDNELLPGTLPLQASDDAMPAWQGTRLYLGQVSTGRLWTDGPGSEDVTSLQWFDAVDGQPLSASVGRQMRWSGGDMAQPTPMPFATHLLLLSTGSPLMAQVIYPPSTR